MRLAWVALQYRDLAARRERGRARAPWRATWFSPWFAGRQPFPTLDHRLAQSLPANLQISWRLHRFAHLETRSPIAKPSVEPVGSQLIHRGIAGLHGALVRATRWEGAVNSTSQRSTADQGRTWIPDARAASRTPVSATTSYREISRSSSVHCVAGVRSQRGAIQVHVGLPPTQVWEHVPVLSGLDRLRCADWNARVG
jgi:hypothetical protein